MRHDLSDDPAVISLADLLKMPIPEVVGRLHAFWSWADMQTADGHAGVTLAWLNERFGRDACVTLSASRERNECVTGAPLTFGEALVKVGWLTVTDDGIQVPHFDHYMSQSAKRRLLTARRNQMYRAKKVSEKRDATVTQRASPQNRREENTDLKAQPLAHAAGNGTVLGERAGLSGLELGLTGKTLADARAIAYHLAAWKTNGEMAASIRRTLEDRPEKSGRIRQLCEQTASTKRRSPAGYLRRLMANEGLI